MNIETIEIETCLFQLLPKHLNVSQLFLLTIFYCLNAQRPFPPFLQDL